MSDVKAFISFFVGAHCGSIFKRSDFFSTLSVFHQVMFGLHYGINWLRPQATLRKVREMVKKRRYVTSYA